jgi:anti-sigma-K factor RskA
MNWYHHANAVDQLASAYVLGTLQGRARRRFEAVLHSQPQRALVTDAVERWTQRLAPMLTTLAPMQPSAALWGSIAQRAGIAGKPQQTSSWWRRWLAPIPAGALAMGLVLGTLVPVVWQIQQGEQQDTLLPESYVGVLANTQGKQGLIVSSLRQGLAVDVKQVTPVDVPPGSTLYLWRIDQAGVVAPIGPLANGKFVRMPLSEPAEKVFFTAVELAVSVEPLGTSPSAPGQAFVYRGLCGKLWKPKAS